MADRHLIGLYSPAPQSGKTFAATALEHKGFTRISFAEPLRLVACEFLIQLGFRREEAMELLLVGKHKVIPDIGITARQLLQRMGTEFGRQQISSDVWVRCWAARASQRDKVVADDVRFPNEAKAIKERGGEVWLIRRPSAIVGTDHSSEGQLDNWDGFDTVIDNDGSLLDFRRKIDAALWG